MIGRFLYKHSPLIILAVLIFSSLSVYLLPSLHREVSFDNFMLEGEPAYHEFKNFNRKLGSQDNLFILAIHNHPTIYQEDFLKKLKLLSKLIDSTQAVTHTTSLLDLEKYTRIMPGYYHKRPYLQASHPERFQKDSFLIAEDSLLTRHFLSANHNWTKILFKVKQDLTLSTVDSLVQKIDSAALSMEIGNTHLMGRKYMESEFLKLMNSEFITSLLLSLGFIVLILWWLHRSVAGVLLPLICVAISLLMLYAYMALFNRPLTILSNLFPTIVLIIGISDVIHISSKFSQESLKGHPRIKAMDITLKEVGLTTLINTLTTAIGFLTLLFMSMKAMQSFGIDAAVGLLITWINAVILLPALMVRFDLSGSFRKTTQSQHLRKLLEWINIKVSSNPKTIAWIFGVVVLASLFGIFQINTNNFMLTSLPDNNRLRDDFAFFDQQSGGGRTLEIIIEAREGYHIYDQPVLEQIARLESYLTYQMKLNQVISPTLPVKWIHRSASRKNEWSLPSEAKDFRIYRTQLNTGELSMPVSITDSTGSIGRLTGRWQDEGRISTQQKINQLENWIKNNSDTSIVRFKVTGSDFLTDLAHQRRIENTVTGFILEVIVIALIIGLLYKSGLLVLITFIANLIPILIVAGFMGYTGIELRGSNTIIFAIGYVIAADDTLHFINRYRLELRKGCTVKEAVRNTLLFTGRPLVLTSLILLGGFVILLHSSFGDVFYHGLLVSLIILAALMTDLLLTPVMLLYFFRKRTNH